MSDVVPKWKERVFMQKWKLDKEIENLLDFIEANNQPDIFGTLSADERRRLRIQHQLMQDLSAVLGERIAADFK